jgi:diaminopimelate decarboxylase
VGPRVLSGGVARVDGTLQVEGVGLPALAEAVGTPAYVYSAAVVRARYAALVEALAGTPHRVHYSVKANGCGGLLRLLRELGSGVDVVSGGELHKARRAGFVPADDIIFGGVGKTDAELREGIAAGVKLINAESLAEVDRIGALAAAMGRTAQVGLRVNPEIPVANWHDYIKTGEKGHKFGIPYGEALAVAERALALPGIALAGVDMHVGSQLASLEPYANGVRRLLDLVSAIRAAGGRELRYLDVGGGLPVTYDAETTPDLAAFGAIVSGAAREAGLELLVEPGRFLVGNAGLLLTRVLYRKRSGGKEIVITDAGMTELLRPSHYQAYHRIEPVAGGGSEQVVDVVGPVCETGDFLALDRPLPDVAPGALLAVHDAGAYGYVMASTYNARLRPPEVLVDGGRFAVVTERECYEDLTRLEPLDPAWREG